MGRYDFEVGEDGLTVDGYRILDPASKKSMYLSHLILASILTLIVVASLSLYGDDLGGIMSLGSMTIIAFWILAVIYLAAGPEEYYRRYRYRLDDEKLEIRRGILIISHELVPIERIHQVEVSRGPINRHYNLANVNVTTAGGVVQISYLEDDVAESIALKLNDTVVSILRERD